MPYQIDFTIQTVNEVMRDHKTVPAVHQNYGKLVAEK